MIYLTHADIFCIQTASLLQCTRVWTGFLQQRFGCIILSEHFLDDRLCCAKHGRVVDSKQAGSVFVNVGQESKRRVS